VSEIGIDSLVPPQMARRAEGAGVAKAELDALSMFGLAVLAGAFIGLGAIFSTIAVSGAPDMAFGVKKVFGGLVFSLGLILVVIGGAELFTGNNLIVMAWASGKVSTAQLLRNWGIVYVGNFVGSIGTAALMFFTHQYEFGGGAVGVSVLSIANSKVNLGFVQAVALGVMCNVLVCLAVWLTFSARTTIDKIMCVIFPITAFVAAGFEHCVANMYFVPLGLLLKEFDPTFAAGSGLALDQLTWINFITNNLLPVTLGNMVGGAVLVAAVYWFIYLRPRFQAAGQ
jgi:formate transporter